MKKRRLLLASALLVLVAIIAVGCGPKVGDLSGRVTDASGKAIGQAQIKLGDNTATTNADGAFSFKGIELGGHPLEVLVGGEVVSRSTAEVSDKPNVVNIVVAKAKVSGTIRDQDGKPVAAEIAINDLSATTAAGAFTLDGVYYGQQTLAVKIDGAVVYSELVDVNRPDVTVTVNMPPICVPGPNAPADMELALCLNFQDGKTPADFGWEGGDGWTIVDADGQRWIESPAAGVTSIMLRVPQLRNANKVVVEYTTYHALEDSKIWGVNILANDFPGGNALRGGTNFWAISWGTGLRLRRITSNNYPGPGDPAFHESAFPVTRGVPSTLRFTYDHTAKTVDFTVDGERAPGYPWTLADSLLVKGNDHDMLILYTSGTTARWTDFKVWVSQ